MTILFAFLTSVLSATALIGLLLGFKFFMITLDWSLIILLFHKRGLNGLIGEIANFFEFRFKIGPQTERLYAVLPAGVETKTPSETSFFIIFLDPWLIDKEAACLLCLRIETSFIAIPFYILPDLVFTFIINGEIYTLFALKIFFNTFILLNLFIKKP